MAYAVPQSKKSLKQNQFEFTLPDDPERVYTIPLLKYLKPTIIFGHEGSGTDIEVGRRIFAEYLPGAFEKFEDTVQLEEFMKEWQKASGIEVGESPASPS